MLGVHPHSAQTGEVPCSPPFSWWTLLFFFSIFPFSIIIFWKNVTKSSIFFRFSPFRCSSHAGHTILWLWLKTSFCWQNWQIKSSSFLYLFLKFAGISSTICVLILKASLPFSMDLSLKKFRCATVKQQ